VPDRPDTRPTRGARAGLCDSCEHQQLVHTTRGSTFSLCVLSRVDPSYPRYPRIPVRECGGYSSLRPPAEAG